MYNLLSTAVAQQEMLAKNCYGCHKNLQRAHTKFKNMIKEKLTSY